MVLAPTPCLEGDCYEHATNQGRCPLHQRPAWENSYRKQRLPNDWRTRRLIVLKRDQGICYLCGNPGSDTIDHIKPGDDHSLENLAPVHDRTEPYCHRYKSSAEGHQAQAGNRIKQRR